MSRDLVLKLIDGKRITNADLAEALEEICDEVHTSCFEECPVYDEGYRPEDTGFCPYRGHGKKMLAFIKKSRKENPLIR